MASEEKKRISPDLIVVLAMLVVAIVIVVGFVIYTNKKAEKAITSAMGTDYSEQLQQSADEYKENVNDIIEDMKQDAK